jgi:origin recognition complex subunit 1
MAVTPRRSTRGALFTPSPHPNQVVAPANTSYEWISAPTVISDSRTTYTSFRRIIHQPTQGAGPSRTPLKQRRKVGKADEESRFTVGDGVMVGVDGGDGVGVVIGLWQDTRSRERIREDEGRGDDEEEDGEEEEEEEEEGPAKGMMAEVHWCFRKQDLPSVMKNLNVEDVSLSDLLNSSSTFRRSLKPGSML